MSFLPFFWRILVYVFVINLGCENAVTFNRLHQLLSFYPSVIVLTLTFDDMKAFIRITFQKHREIEREGSDAK